MYLRRVPDATTNRRERWALGLLWVLLLTLYGGTVSHSWTTPDVASAEIGAWRIASTGAPWVDGLHSDKYVLSTDATEMDSDARARLVLFATANERNGHVAIGRSPGVIAIGVPAYWIQERISPSSAAEVAPEPGGLTGAFLAASAVLLLLLALRGLVSFRLIIGAGLALGLATPYWSVLADALWTHGVTTLGIAGLAWAVRHERWWLAGIFGGVAVWGRLHVAVIVAVVGLGLAVWRRRPGIAIRIAVTSVPFLAGTFVWGYWMYGRWSLFAASGGYSQATGLTGVPDESSTGPGVVTNLLGYLVSPDAGLLVWTPVLLALAPAVLRAWPTTPDWTRVLACGGIAYLVVQAFLNIFPGGTGFWGNRLGLETLTCLVPVVVCSLPQVRAGERLVAIVLLSYQAGVILLGAAFDLAHRHGLAWREYEPYLALRDNAAATSVTIGLGMAVTVVVWRVLSTDRDQLSADPAT